MLCHTRALAHARASNALQSDRRSTDLREGGGAGGRSFKTWRGACVCVEGGGGSARLRSSTATGMLLVLDCIVPPPSAPDTSHHVPPSPHARTHDITPPHTHHTHTNKQASRAHTHARTQARKHASTRTRTQRSRVKVWRGCVCGGLSARGLYVCARAHGPTSPCGLRAGPGPTALSGRARTGHTLGHSLTHSPSTLQR